MPSGAPLLELLMQDMSAGQETRFGTPRVKRIWPHRLWVALFRARRKARRAERLLVLLQQRHAKELKANTERFEEWLEDERVRFNQMQLDLTNKVVQLAGLTPIMQTDLRDQRLDPKYRLPDDGGLRDILTETVAERYEDEKVRFFEEGQEIGLSPAAISERWKQVEPTVLEDITS